MCPEHIRRLAAKLMPASIAVMLIGAWIGFVDHQDWSLQTQVLAHISLMLGAAFLKLSYVMHLNASKHLGINDFAREASEGSDTRLPECCVQARDKP